VISLFFSMPSVLTVAPMHDVGQGNVNILQRLQSGGRSALALMMLFLNQLIKFYLNNVTNLHQ